MLHIRRGTGINISTRFSSFISVGNLYRVLCDTDKCETDNFPYLQSYNNTTKMGNSDSKLATLNAEQKETLNQFFNHLYDNMLQLQESDQVIFDIREAVREIVRDLAMKIGDIDKRFKIGDIILVGSAMEGTRNITPNEYDFLLVLDVLSQPGVISVSQNCRYSEGHVHITVENNDIKTQYKAMLSDGKLIGSDMDLLWVPMVRSLRYFFGNVLEDTVKNMFNRVSVKMLTGSLSFSSQEVQLHGPAFKLMLNWQENGNADTEISVDLCRHKIQGLS